MKIKVTYQSNYNGCDVEVDPVLANIKTIKDACEEVEESIINCLFDEPYSDEEHATTCINSIVKRTFGEDVTIEIVFDHFSS